MQKKLRGYLKCFLNYSISYSETLIWLGDRKLFSCLLRLYFFFGVIYTVQNLQLVPRTVSNAAAEIRVTSAHLATCGTQTTTRTSTTTSVSRVRASKILVFCISLFVKPKILSYHELICPTYFFPFKNVWNEVLFRFWLYLI